MMILVAVCILHVFFQNANGWQLPGYLATGASCKINNVYAGTCKLREYCDNIPLKRNSGAETYSSGNADTECAPHHVCCLYTPPNPMNYVNPQQIRKPGLGEACSTTDGLTGTCRTQAACDSMGFIIHERYGSRICSPRYVCCLNTGYPTPTAYSTLTVQQTPSTGLSAKQLYRDCRTWTAASGFCTSIQQCRHSDSYLIRGVCDFQQICCPINNYAAVTPTTARPVTSRKLTAGEKCNTAAGATGSCTLKTSCTIADYSTDMRSGDDKCTPEYVCCTNTGYQVPPAESLTVQSLSRTSSTGQLARPHEGQLSEDCRTVAGTEGTCTLRSSCSTLDYSINIRYGGDKCTMGYVCCPNTNYHVPTTESLTVRPRNWMPSTGQSSALKEKAQFGEECNTIVGTKGSCTPITSCNTLDHSINVRSGGDKCAPEYVCCPNTNYLMPTEESLTVRPAGRIPSAGQSARLEGEQINKVCRTQHGTSGLCSLRQQCRHLYYASDFNDFSDDCDVQHICCPVDSYAAVTATTATPVTTRKPTAGEECRTVVGTNGRCTPRSSCNKLDHSIDVRHGGDKCNPEYVCCPNTDYQMPTEESLTLPPMNRKPLAGQFGKVCRTQNGTSGLCSLRQQCRHLYYALDFGDYSDVCDVQHICCPVENYAAVTMTTPRPVTTRIPTAGEECNTITGIRGRCMLTESCSTLDDNIDVRFGNKKCGQEYVCCPNTSYRVPTTESLTLQPGSRRQSEGQSISSSAGPTTSQGLWSGEESFNCIAAGREGEGIQCGFRNSIALQMLGVWSRPIEKHEFPWMVAVLRFEGKSKYKTYLCGGSLIHYSVVLTAAHCVNNQGRLQVRVGAFNLSQQEDGVQAADSKRVIIHQDYNKDNYIYNVALIIVKKPFKRSSSVGLICLPTPDITVDSDSCVTTGWGNLLKQYGSPLLRMESQPLVAMDTCQRQLGFNLQESLMCAGGAPYGALVNGDDGSPLVCTNGLRFYQRGIFVWSKQDRHDLPNVYTDVSKVLPWISDQMRSLQLKC